MATLRSHHHLRGFVKLVSWDVYCVNGRGSFRLGYVGVGFWMKLWLLVRYLLCWGVDFVVLVILASSPYSSELFVPGGGLGIYIRLFRKEVVETWRWLLLKHVVLFCYKYRHLAIFIVVFWLKFTPPYTLVYFLSLAITSSPTAVLVCNKFTCSVGVSQ